MTPRLVLVEWEDACGRDHGWRTVAKAVAEAREPYLISTAGWLVASDRRRVVVSFQLTADGKASETMTIPRGWVRRVRRLR